MTDDQFFSIACISSAVLFLCGFTAIDSLSVRRETGDLV